MIEERYRVVLLGRMKSTADREKVVEKLAFFFKLTPEKLEKYFDGKKRTIKEGLSLDRARRYHGVFKKFGALSEIEVVFDKKILDAASVSIQKAHSQEQKRPAKKCSSTKTSTPGHHKITNEDNGLKGEKDPIGPPSFNSSLRYESNAYALTPPVFSRPVSVPILGSSGSVIGSIRSKRSIVGWASILFLTIISAFLIQRTILQLMISQTGTGLMTTWIGILAFLSCLLFLPKWVGPGKKIIIQKSVDGEEKLICRCREKKSGSAFTREFEVRDEAGNLIAKIKRNLLFSQYSCLNGDGRIIYEMEAEQDVEESALSLGKDVRDDLFAMVSWVSLIFSHVTHLLNGKKHNNKRSVKWIRCILDANGSDVATVEFSKSCIRNMKTFLLNINPDASANADRPILLTFALVLVGI